MRLVGSATSNQSMNYTQYLEKNAPFRVCFESTVFEIGNQILVHCATSNSSRYSHSGEQKQSMKNGNWEGDEERVSEVVYMRCVDGGQGVSRTKVYARTIAKVNKPVPRRREQVR